MGNQPIDPPPPGGVPPQPGGGAPPSPGQLPGWSEPGAGWAPPGWGLPGAPSAMSPGWGSPPPSPWGGPGYPGWSGQYPPPGVPSGNRRGKVIVAAAGAILIAAAVAIPVVLLTRHSPVIQAAAAYKQAMQAGGQSAGFRYVDTWSGGGSTATFSGVAGQSDGIQTVSQTTGFGKEQFEVVLAPDQTVYVKGNDAALEDQLGLPASTAAGLSGTWISAQSSDAPYQDLEEGLTIGSALPGSQLTPTSTKQVTGSGGAALTRIEGTVSDPSGTGHLDVSPGSNLPVTFVATAGDGSYTETMTFTQWGVVPVPTVPASAVAWATLSSSAPPDGYGSGETPPPAPTTTPSSSGVGSAA